MDIVALAGLTEAMRPKAEGERVNVHVVRHVDVPTPDFARMQILASPQKIIAPPTEAPVDEKRRILPANA